MKLFKIVLIDWKISVRKKLRYIVLILVSYINCCQFKTGYLDAGIRCDKIFLADCLAFMQQGVQPLKYLSGMDEYYIPPAWILWLFIIFLAPLDYPGKSKNLWGCQYIIRMNKSYWWFSKCIYTVFVNLWSFSIYIITVVAFCLANGYVISFKYNESIYEYLFGNMVKVNGSIFTEWNNIVGLIMLPIVAIIAISYIQLLLSVYVNPVIAYACTIIGLMISAYDSKFCLLGNSLMAVRLSLFTANGVKIENALVFCIVVCITVIVIGLILVKKYDFGLCKEEE
ncbi:MAG: hypothetical protein V8R00_07545 [Coprococcus catus]